MICYGIFYDQCKLCYGGLFFPLGFSSMRESPSPFPCSCCVDRYNGMCSQSRIANLASIIATNTAEVDGFLSWRSEIFLPLY